jgi:hypothetical protein
MRARAKTMKKDGNKKFTNLLALTVGVGEITER